MNARANALERDQLARKRLGPRLRATQGHCLTPTAPSSEPTAREIQVIELIADGLLTEEIATALLISVWTVRAHVVHIKAKMGARTRAHLVKLSVQRGYLVIADDG